MKFSVSLLALSAFVFAGCDTLATRRSLYSPQTPGKNQGTFSVILREQTYLKGIDRKHLRPWTVKQKDEPAANPLPPEVGNPPPTRGEEMVAPPAM